MLIKREVAKQAGSFSFNIATAAWFDNDPIFVALSAWIDTPGPLDTSIMQFAVNYIDAGNNPHQVLWQATPQLIMADPAQFFVTDVVMLKRFEDPPGTGPSAFTFNGTLVFGTPGAALYTYNLALITDPGNRPIYI